MELWNLILPYFIYYYIISFNNFCTLAQAVQALQLLQASQAFQTNAQVYQAQPAHQVPQLQAVFVKLQVKE